MHRKLPLGKKAGSMLDSSVRFQTDLCNLKLSETNRYEVIS